MRLFLYGTLLDPDRLARIAGRPGLGRRLHPAVLSGWRRVARGGGRFPTLRRAPRQRVPGALAMVDAAALRRLGAYEGPEYRLTRVAVRAGRRETAAFAWIAPGGTARPW